MSPPGPQQDLVQRNPDGSLTKETLKRAMKAFRRRLKLTREEDENRLGHDAMTSGRKSAIVGIKPPEQYPQEVWDALVELGRLRRIESGVYEITEG
ncbi:MAG: hypothetical protein KDB80_07565 [Planctomycetes bacterium]|nr:hypothetical protein [Planctomycetota bacterium]